MAVFANDWKHQKILSADISTIHNSLAATSVSYIHIISLTSYIAIIMNKTVIYQRVSRLSM